MVLEMIMPFIFINFYYYSKMKKKLNFLCLQVEEEAILFMHLILL